MELREWMFHKRISDGEMAEKVACTRNYLNLIKRKAIKPSYRLAKDIEQITQGQVTIAELMSEN